jgi:phage portal protein BeeE
VVAVLALYDVCYLLKVGGYDAEGVPVGLLPLDPAQVQPTNPAMTISPLIPAEEYTVGQTVVSRDQLVILRRSPLPGVDESSSGLIRLARTEFAGYLAASGYNSRYWQSGGSPQVVLETDQQLPDAIATQMSDRWRERRSKGPDYAPVLQGGLKARDFGADPTLASAVEVRKEMVADVGRYFGIPTSKLNAPTGDPTTYDSTEAQGQDLLKFTLAGYIGALEDAISDQLPGGRRMEMETAKLTVSTVLSQAQALQLATGGKAWMDVDEARELWHLGPIESPDTLNPEPVPAPVTPGGMAND